MAIQQVFGSVWDPESNTFTGSAGSAVERGLQDKLEDFISVKDFGAVGDASTDDRDAIIAADAEAASTGKTLFFPPGQYRCSDGVTKTAKKWLGAGAPVCGVFPQRNDDKEFLRPGFKDKLPGSSLLFTGTGTQTATTQRSDGFSSFTYCVQTTVTGGLMKGIGIILDVDVLDSGGNLTAFGSDNTAIYDVGYYIDNAARNYHEDFVVFGYFNLAGAAIRAVLQSGVDNPDYNVFVAGSTMGNYGMALIGSQSNDGLEAGLSGTQWFGMNIYSKDHHSRSDASYNTADAWACLFIDGFTAAANDNINGHYMFGGNIRTQAIHPLVTDHASNLSFVQTIFELPNGTVPGKTDSKSFVATSNSNDFMFMMCRFGLDPIYVPSFSDVISGKLNVIGQPHDGVAVSEQNAATTYSVRMGASGGTGDPAIQFLSGSPSSSANGWVIRRDISASDVLLFNWDNVNQASLTTSGALTVTSITPDRFNIEASSTLTIAAGVVTITGSNHRIDTEALAATDDLTTINGGVTNDILILRAASSARTVVVKDGTGNIRSAGDFSLDNGQDTMMLQYDGVTWNELSRSNNS